MKASTQFWMVFHLLIAILSFIFADHLAMLNNWRGFGIGVVLSAANLLWFTQELREGIADSLGNGK